MILSFLKRNKSSVLSFRDCSSTITPKPNQLINSKNCELLNIIHHELNKPSYHPSISTKHIAIQCSSDDFNSQLNPSDLILIGHLSSTKSFLTSSIPLLPGYNECGIQVDLNDNHIDCLVEIYSNRLSIETIRQFYEVCHSDIQWTRTQIDEYLQYHNETKITFPTLSQLSLNVLNQWNEQIKSLNPFFDTKSITDLLKDINDDEIFEELTSDIEVTNSNQINLPWSMVNSLEELYGELPNKSSLSSDNNGLLLPLDDDLSMNIYQALQRFLNKSNQTIKPVNKNQNQRWKVPSQKPDIKSSSIPSLKQIMNEEQQAAKSQQSKKVIFCFFFLSINSYRKK